MRLTQKQETFTLNLFKGMSQREAYIQAGYSQTMAVSTIDENACRLANSNKVLTRYDELRQKTEDESVATVLERKQVLTKVVRNPLIPYEIKTKDSIAAITELNKMEKIYTNGASVNIDNRSVNVYVNSEKSKDLTQRLLEGERTDASKQET